MIPKIIHYCWFGRNKKPDDVHYCIDTWKRHMPDYTLMEWNEDNFLIDEQCEYVKQAYEAKKWAFVSDYARLEALYKYGGIYFDTDVEVFKSFDSFLNNHEVFGFESNDSVMTAVMMCEKRSDFVKEFMRFYEKNSFVRADGTLKTDLTNVIILSNLLKKKGLKDNGKEQMVGQSLILPQSFFSPNDLRNIFGKYKKENYSYHHCEASWYREKGNNGFARKCKKYLVISLRNIMGSDKVANSSLRSIFGTKG